MEDNLPNTELSKEEKSLLKDISREAREEEKAKTVYTSFFETEKSLVEQIKPIIYKDATGATGATSPDGSRFLVYDKVTGSIDYLPYLEYHGKTYYPIESKILSSGVLTLPSGIEEYGETSELVNEIHDFLYRNFQVPSFWEYFLPYIILFYWVYEKFPFIPYLHFVGLTGTGKSTAQEVLGSICYKPMNVSGSITVSPIFRTSSEWHGTLLLDEFEPDGESYKEMLSLLKSGVGNVAVLRTEGDKKKEVNVYIIKSPKMFTSERPINNAGLRSRTFIIEMEKNKRRVPLYRLDKFNAEAATLRNKLLLWRLRNFDKISLEDIEYGFPELSGFDGRVQQVITPIYYLSDEETREKILEFAKIQEEETKLERAESLEGKIFQQIMASYPVDMTLKALTEEINKEAGKRPISAERIASLVRHTLQLKIERMGHENIRTVLASESEQRLKDLCVYFGVGWHPPETVAEVAPVADAEIERTDAQTFATGSEGLFSTLDENGVPVEEER